MEYKFRARKVNTSEWVYGYYVADVEWAQYYMMFPKHDGVYITMQKVSVDPKTVGRFVGIKDINGIEVYTGDIIKHGNSIREIIEIDCRVLAKRVGSNECILLSFSENPEVIGNIYTNPELLNAK